MAIEGGCYCGEIRYISENPAQAQLQCHCRECQYISGGYPNAIMVVPEEGFLFTKGTPASFAREDLERPVTRFFCGTCGTAIGTRSPARPGSFIIKIVRALWYCTGRFGQFIYVHAQICGMLLFSITL